jgi:hypothetical protein
MQSVMVVPSRGRFAMSGLEGAADIPQVIHVGQFGLSKLTDDELKRLYIFAQTSVSLRAKCAALSQLSMMLTADPTLMGFYRSTADGQAFVDALAAAKGFFLAMSQPNIMVTLQNLSTDLVVNHLAKRGYGVSGRMPIYVNGKPTLSYADTRVVPPSNVPAKGTIDFGDLAKTKMYDDANTLNLIASDLDIKGLPSLGVIEPVTASIVLAIIKYVVFPIIISVGLYTVITAFGSKKFSVELPPGFDKFSPELQKAILEGKDLLEGVKEVAKWLAIGAGIVVAGGAVFYFFSKD